MLSFHNDPKIKKFYLDRVIAHRKADNIIKGTGWQNGKGCAIGCILEEYSYYKFTKEGLGPIWLAFLVDKIFEGLPNKKAQMWPEKFLKSLPLGVTEKEFEDLKNKLAIKRQERNLKLMQSKQFKITSYIDEVKNSIKLVIEYHKNPTAQLAESAWSAAKSAWSAAKSAAESAWSAPWSAAEPVAWSAARSAELAAWSAAESVRSAESVWSAELAAWSAAESVWSALSAWSAAWEQEAKDLLSLLKKLTKN